MNPTLLRLFEWSVGLSWFFLIIFYCTFLSIIFFFLLYPYLYRSLFSIHLSISLSLSLTHTHSLSLSLSFLYHFFLFRQNYLYYIIYIYIYTFSSSIERLIFYCSHKQALATRKPVVYPPNQFKVTMNHRRLLL